MMFAIIRDAFGALVWGVAIAVAVVFVVAQLGKALATGFRWNLWSLSAVLLLFVITLVQGTLWVGSMYARGYVENVSAIVVPLAAELNGQAAGVQNDVATCAADNLATIKEKLADEYPLLQSYIKNIEADATSSPDANGIVAAIEDSVNTAITWYQVRRILWVLGLSIVATAVLCSTSSGQGRHRDRALAYRDRDARGRSRRSRFDD